MNTNTEIELFLPPLTDRNVIPKETDSAHSKLSRINTYFGFPSPMENLKRKGNQEKSAICNINN